MSAIPINSGTGPGVAVDLVGTDNYQVVKIMQAASGATAAMGSTLAVSGTVSVSNSVTITPSGTQSVSVVNVLSASNVTIAGTVAVSGTNTALQGGAWNIGTVTTLLGTVAVSGGGGGAQYPVDSTTMAATATGTVILGMQSGATTARGLALTTTGGIFNIQTVATITTLLGTVSVSGGGGGVQYSQGTTSIAATGTGTILFGIQSTTAFAVGITGSNQMLVSVANVVSASGVTVASITTGTVNVVNVLSASGITVASLTTGTMNVVNVLSASGVTIASVATGTMNVINVLSASGVTIASVTTGTMNVVNVLSASNVTIASIATGTVSIINTPVVTVSNSLYLSQPTTASNLNGNVVVTNSSNSIVITSGAYTILVTDLVISVDVPMNVTLFSAGTTKMGPFYFATKGGLTLGLTSPIKLNSNQSLTVTPSLTGSCSVFAAGFSTV